MDITFTALAVLAASLLGGYALRALIHSAGRRWLNLGADTVSVMGATKGPDNHWNRKSG